MKIHSLLILSLLFIPCNALGAELLITVCYPDKTPAKGIKVQQVQLERPGLRSYLFGVTDEDGEIKAKFEEKKSSYQNSHGYGVYKYVVMPENHRWEVSDLFYWNKEPWSLKTGVWQYGDYKERISKAKANWSIGKLIKVRTGDKLRWEVTLSKGKNIEVAVVDQFNEPVKNKKLSVTLDLGALSHTGRGGEIPMFKVQTDSEGRFNLPNVGNFYYSFDLQDHRYCAPDVGYWTGIVKSKFDQDKGRLVYHECIGKEITVIVTDKQTGNPIPEASIIQVNLFSTTRQGGPIGYTDSNGKYRSKNFYTEHVVEFGVAKTGYKSYMLPIEQFVPGKIYKILLEPKISK